MLAPGHLLQARYRIVGTIAHGGMGAVYQAIDERLDHTVALKQILHRDPTLRAAFAQEARLLAALRHPALPKVTDHFVEGDDQFLVMEFVPGDDLATLALRQRDPLDVARVVRWADQLLDALTYLHSQRPPIIHRDIKPNNLKLTTGGAVMLLDFGLAKGAPPHIATPTTAPALVGYTLAYAAPEQLRGEEGDATSDLYALAATLYDLLTTTKPPDARQRLAALANGDPDPLLPLHTVNPAVPLPLAATIERALALTPRDRFADAATMRLALHSAGEATQVVTPRIAPEEGAAIPPPAHNLPVQLTSFVARESEVSAVQTLLQDARVRLVTLTGPGGIGKTRLAVAVATRALADFRDGVFFVSLAPIHERELVLPTIAQSLGQRESTNTSVRQSLHAYLRDQELLLVLDNFEQVVAAAPDVADLLSHAPRLKLLVTSRESLQVRGEQEYPVPILALPDLRHLPPLESLGDYAAIRLFVQRAVAVRPDFVLDANNAAAIAEICRRLDGLPLALELAAASLKIMSVHALLARLAERIDLPSRASRDLPDRQRTLAASIGWSYELLTDDERAVFRRMAIFAGSFALAAAEAVCRQSGVDDAAVLDILAALISKSLLKPVDHDGLEAHAGVEVRFTMLETIREFGLRQLTHAGEHATVAAAHAAYYAHLIEDAESKIWGAQMGAAVQQLETEIENVRATLAYYHAHPDGAEAALRLAGRLWRFWEIRGYIQEGRAWFTRTLQRRAEVPPASRWLPLHGAGNLAVDQGEYAIANTHYREALDVLEAMLPTVTDPVRIAHTRYAIGNTLANIGHAAMLQSQWAEAVEFSEAAVAIQRELVAGGVRARAGALVGLAIPITNLALIELYQSNYAQAEQYGNEGLAIYRELGDGRGIGWNLHTLGTVARERGDFAHAAKLYAEAESLFAALTNQADLPAFYVDQGELARVQGDDSRATAIFQAGLTLAQTLGNKKERAILLDRLSVVARHRADYAQATAYSDESVTLFREVGNLLGLSEALYTRGTIAFAQRTYPAARRDWQESLHLKAQLGERKGLVALFKSLAALILATGGQGERAGRFLAAAEKLRTTIGAAIPPVDQETERALLQTVRAQLGDMLFPITWAMGQAMNLEEAIAYARKELAS